MLNLDFIIIKSFSILFGGGIIGKLKKEYNNIINKLTDRIYHKYLKQFKLEE